MRKQLYIIPLCIAVLALAGCDKKGLTSEQKEEQEPLVKSGQSFVEQKQWDSAEDAFKKAIEKDGTLATPHLQLALIYAQFIPNYIHSIYHFDRYLELRPESEKAEFIREQRNKVQVAYAKQIIISSADVKQLQAQAQALSQENTTLKRQLQEAKAAAAAAAQPPRETTPVAVVETPQPTTPSTAGTGPRPTASNKYQIYHVAAGDTLSKIATKFYGDSSLWDIVYDANKDTINNPGSLRVGQTLVIPALNK